jgi:twitching motility two-component system response regulator PilH
MDTTQRAPRAILMVDDSAFARMKLRDALLEDGYTVVQASNGQAALDAIAKQEFDCIITDLLMPGMDGFGHLAEIQKRQVHAPVVVLSADIQKSTHTRCQELGAAGFVQKPLNATNLRRVLSQVLGERVAP